VTAEVPEGCRMGRRGAIIYDPTDEVTHRISNLSCADKSQQASTSQQGDEQQAKQQKQEGES